MTVLRASVRAAFRSFTEKNEGRINWFYLDVRELPTIGAGCIVDRVELALKLPMVWPDGRRATLDEIREDWARVAADKSLAALTAGAAAAAKVARLRLPQADLDRLTDVRLDANVADLARRYPVFTDAPASAQLGMLSMAWAMGTDTMTREFPKFSAHVHARDWASAADECKMRESDNPGLIHRNRADRLLFLAAAWVADTGADPEPLRWAPPADEAPTPEPGPTLRDEAMRAWGMQIPVENEPPPSGRE